MVQGSEEAAEFVATVRTEHVPMKTWYMGDSPAAVALKQKYGPYPDLWKEVLNWTGWKETRKEYLKEQQQGESNDGSNNDVPPQPAIPRKRKSRWGTADESNKKVVPASSNNSYPAGRSYNSSNNNNGYNNGGINSSMSSPYNNGHGGNGNRAAPLPLPLPQALPPQKQEEMRRLQSRLRIINDKLSNLDKEAARVDALPRGHRERSPSPPPIYNAHGVRQNTRAVRWRERYSAERQDLLDKMLRMDPRMMSASQDLFVRKRTKKIRIPIEDHPTYNFIGLIIGPRGKTQKELEGKTGCKIAIRGRGSVKEGARGRRDGKLMEGDNEPLHVVITGDDQKAVDAASDMITQMLVVIDDEKNVHKQQQLRELALLNGTLKEEEFCQICAEKGHRSFECPKRLAMNNKKNVPLVKCAICGDTSHPTRDCRQKPEQATTNQQELDSDYLNFMAELDGKKAQVKTEGSNGDAPPKSEATSTTTLPPSLPGVPPLPVLNGTPPPPPGLTPPPMPPVNAALPLPPPPPGGVLLPPPPPLPNVVQPNFGYNAQQPPQQQYNAYGPPPPGQYSPAPPPAAPVPQVKPGEETAGWDPSAFYDSSNNNGAGGFNWWG